ncbi:hypothetical protein AMK68_04590 [candidate division KD3-62 bacterium DG_56]|uniref:Uncharacterized protein n=1 Tax=candidate division KD3-62 bacterium DG_56 TaxID=1704032 RepID=A0A0S7XKL2_9BACT|nr:MAG: hypothetical protein AMK68_04590 [candidate division KD3-62 bacterium DG_56]
MRRLAAVLTICVLLGAAVYMLRPRMSPEAVVEEFLWALDRGDLDAATRRVHEAFAERVRRASAGDAGPNHAIERLTVGLPGQTRQMGWHYDEVNVTIKWRNGKPSARFERLFRDQVADEPTTGAWAVVFSLEKRYVRGWVILTLLGGA